MKKVFLLFALFTASAAYAATITGSITVNEREIIEVASDPGASGGTVATPGSLALSSMGSVYMKTGSGATAWTKIAQSTTDLAEGSNLYYTDARAKAASVNDTAYNATSWDGVLDVAASKNAVRDKLEAIPTETKTYTNLSTKEDSFFVLDSANNNKRLRFVFSVSGADGDMSVIANGAAGDTFTLPNSNDPLVTENGSATLRNKYLVTDTTVFIDNIWGSEMDFNIGGGGISGAGMRGTLAWPITNFRTITFPDRTGTVVVPIANATTKGDWLVHNGTDLTRFAGSACLDTQIIEKDSTTATGWKCSPKPSSGSAAMSQVEVDFGSAPLTEKLFTISDAGISAGMKIVASVARETSTGKAYEDETDMDEFMISCTGKAASMSCMIRSQKGQFRGTLKINYMIGA